MPDSWTNLINQLAPPVSQDGRYSNQDAWLRNIRPVIEHLISSTEQLRNSHAWQENVDRRPTHLPSTFRMALWLLPYPCLQPVDVAAHMKCAAFTTEVLCHLQRMVRSGKPFRDDYEELRAAAVKLGDDDRVRVSCEIGRVEGQEQKLTMTDYLRVDLAESLIDVTKTLQDTKLRTAIGNLVRTWRNHQDEEIRKIGWKLTKLALRKCVEGPMEPTQAQDDYLDSTFPYRLD